MYSFLSLFLQLNEWKSDIVQPFDCQQKVFYNRSTNSEHFVQNR